MLRNHAVHALIQAAGVHSPYLPGFKCQTGEFCVSKNKRGLPYCGTKTHCKRITETAISSEWSGSSGYLGQGFSQFYSMQGGIQKLNSALKSSTSVLKSGKVTENSKKQRGEMKCEWNLRSWNKNSLTSVRALSKLAASLPISYRSWVGAAILATGVPGR